MGTKGGYERPPVDGRADYIFFLPSLYFFREKHQGGLRGKYERAQYPVVKNISTHLHATVCVGGLES